ncbi:malate transporter, aliminium toerance [Trichoderma arundinaceum]|uniref:Malate transporter, aliminium toerance n=1 Tax=Trichoderma arundinaceum TaxID=490622 RepID=A0A395NRQ0_TRIAR|nr:malate transporter, aliminium toerance [Trichoderma arundinaceum]
MAMAKLLRRLLALVWGDCGTKDLWQRILKDFIACVIATIIAILPQLKGWSTFLIPMVVAFAHPGQRMGVVIENIIMVIFGSALGLSWSMLGLYLASLVYDTNKPAAFTIRALFYLACTLLHGYLRSSSPRLFLFVLFVILPPITMLTVPTEATPTLYTSIYVPILIGVGVMFFANIVIFPEFSSSYLGTSTINALSEMVDTLERATHWFVTPGGDHIESRNQGSVHDISVAGDGGIRRQQQQQQMKQNQSCIVRHWHKFLSAFPNPFRSSGSVTTASGAPLHGTTLASLTESKAIIRSKLTTCKTAQNEVNFEISISPLAPTDMKPISVDLMSNLSQTIITLIGACENKFIVLDDEGLEESVMANDDDGDDEVQSQRGLDGSATPSTSVPEANLNLNSGRRSRSRARNSAAPSSRVDYIELNRQMELSNAKLLESIVMRIREPVQEFQASTNEAVILLISCLAYCYDVPTLPSGAPTPRGIRLEEIDLRIDLFTDALTLFDQRSAEQLKLIAMQETGESLDFMPRMETFLISSFLLAFRQSSTHILQMLRHARRLVEQRQRRHDRPRIWIPHYSSLRTWLRTAGERDSMVLPEGARQAARRGDLVGDGPSLSKSKDSSDLLVDDEEQAGERAADEEAGSTAAPPSGRSLRNRNIKAKDRRKDKKDKKKKKKDEKYPRSAQRDKGQDAPDSWALRLRGKAADVLEWAQDSDDLAYALRLSFAVFLVSWPAFVPSWNKWYGDVHGSWAPLQLIFVFEVVIGTSLVTFVIRLVGLFLGCTAGYVSFVIAGGSRAITVVVLAFTLLPSAYFHVATKYVKAGAAAIISINVVALASENSTEPSQQVYYKRLVAFIAGGVTATLVEVLISPVRARDRLVESLSACVRHIQGMQGAMAVGVDGPDILDPRSPKLHRYFDHWREKAQASLAAAETFLPFCSTEPRLKGSFHKLAPIYTEIVYVLHQIIDRMDNVVQLRRAYGSSVLEALNPQAYTYRRSMVASCTLMLFSVNEALTTWLPLPQFIPSARLAHIRLIHRVREIITSQALTSAPVTPTASHGSHSRRASECEDQINERIAGLITKHNFLSWNASAAGQLEIIEYLEELVELVKMLVGVNAFRSGMLERPKYGHYARMAEPHQEPLAVTRSNGSSGSSTARQSSIAVQEETGEMQDSVLRRVISAAMRADKAKQRPRGEGDVEAQPSQRRESILEESLEEVPVSLQRVSSRLWQNNAAARRRSYTIASMRSFSNAGT